MAGDAVVWLHIPFKVPAAAKGHYVNELSPPYKELFERILSAYKELIADDLSINGDGITDEVQVLGIGERIRIRQNPPYPWCLHSIECMANDRCTREINCGD